MLFKENFSATTGYFCCFSQMYQTSKESQFLLFGGKVSSVFINLLKVVFFFFFCGHAVKTIRISVPQPVS